MTADSAARYVQTLVHKSVDIGHGNSGGEPCTCIADRLLAPVLADGSAGRRRVGRHRRARRSSGCSGAPRPSTATTAARRCARATRSAYPGGRVYCSVAHAIDRRGRLGLVVADPPVRDLREHLAATARCSWRRAKRGERGGIDEGRVFDDDPALASVERARDDERQVTPGSRRATARLSIAADTRSFATPSCTRNSTTCRKGTRRPTPAAPPRVLDTRRRCARARLRGRSSTSSPPRRASTRRAASAACRRAWWCPTRSRP